MVQENSLDGAWSTAEVAGHPVSVFEPTDPSPHGFAIVYLHAAGCEDLADDTIFSRELGRHGLRAIAPHTGESWWSDRVFATFDTERTPEAYVLEDVVTAAATWWGVRPPQIGLMGVSMGGQGVLRLSYKHPDRFPVAAAISPAIDFHLGLQRSMPQPKIAAALRQMYRDAEDARQDTATLHIHPLNWPRNQYFCSDPADHWHESAERLQMKLSSLGIPHECDLTTEAGGHSWDYFHAMAPGAIEFVVRSLEKERLRVH